MTAPQPVSLLLVCLSYPPVLGGSEVEAQRVSSALIRRGHRVTVLCAGGPPMPDASSFVDSLGVPVRVFARRFHGHLRDYAFALGVARALWRERRKYQLVYFLMQGAHLLTGLPMARALGKPAVMKISGSGIITLMRQSAAGRLELRWLGRWARRVMVLNDGMVDEALAAGLPRERLLWMPNPVDTVEFAPCAPERRAELRAALGIPSAAPVAIFVGRLAPEKELGSLLAGFAAALREFPEALLLVVGDGPLRKDLEARTRTLGLEANARFAGRKPPAEVARLLQASDVFTLVSSAEGLPCSLLEAMSAGLPSVVSDIPANAQLIDPGVHGMHARVGDPESIGAALRQLFADGEARAAMGSAARNRAAERYSMERVVERYEALFQEALNGKGCYIGA